MTKQLSHYGVPGMKWGVRKPIYDAGTRGEKKTHRKDFKKKFNSEVDTARSRVGYSRHKLNLATEKLNAASLAKRGEERAVRVYQRAQSEYLSDRQIANTMKFGKASTLHVMNTRGAIGLAVKGKQRKDTAVLLAAQGKLKQK